MSEASGITGSVSAATTKVVPISLTVKSTSSAITFSKGSKVLLRTAGNQ